MNATAARLQWLFAAQIGLTLMPIPGALLPPFDDAYTLPVWALLGLSIEPPMLLAFWCAFHEGSMRNKLLVLSGGAIYFTLLSYNVVQRFIAIAFPPPLTMPSNLLWGFLEGLAQTAFFLAGLFGFFLATRCCLHNLRLQQSQSHESEPKPTQFSLQHLFLVTLLVSIFLCLARAYRYPWSNSIFSGRDWISSLLLIFALGANAVQVSWATLGDGSVRQRSCLALISAMLVGLAYCAASVLEPKTIQSWLIYTSLMVELPTAILLASFLVLRASGYRLINDTTSRTLACGRVGGEQRPIGRRA